MVRSAAAWAWMPGEPCPCDRLAASATRPVERLSAAVFGAPEAHGALAWAALRHAPAAGRAVLAPVLDAVAAGAVGPRAVGELALGGAVYGLGRTSQAGAAYSVVVLHAPTVRVFVVGTLGHCALPRERGEALLGDGLHSDLARCGRHGVTPHDVWFSLRSSRRTPRCEPGGPGSRGAAYRAATTRWFAPGPPWSSVRWCAAFALRNLQGCRRRLARCWSTGGRAASITSSPSAEGSDW